MTLYTYIYIYIYPHICEYTTNHRRLASDMAAGHGKCHLKVVGALSNDVLLDVRLPWQTDVTHVKRCIRTALDVGFFQQRLLLMPAGRPLRDHEILDSLAGSSTSRQPRQRLQRRYWPVGARPPPEAEAASTLVSMNASHEPIVLALVRLQYVEADDDTVEQLLDAAAGGPTHRLLQLLQQRSDPDQTVATDPDVTALMLASWHGHLAAVALLCDAGAGKDKADAGDATALCAASQEGHLEVVRLLCKEGAEKDLATVHGATALHAASRAGHVKLVHLLCQEGADKDKAAVHGDTALYAASHQGHTQIVRLLCDAGADKDRATVHGVAALFAASQQGHLRVVRLLCDAGADKDNSKEGHATALFAASQEGHVKIVRLLCNAGADKDSATVYGATALYTASHQGHTEMVLSTDYHTHTHAKLSKLMYF